MKKLNCPQCGAPITEIPEEGKYVCEYCGSKLVISKKRPTNPTAFDRLAMEERIKMKKMELENRREERVKITELKLKNKTKIDWDVIMILGFIVLIGMLLLIGKTL